jgi:aminotransferase
MPNTAEKLNYFTESAISEMTNLADQYNAINLSQGNPDFDPPAELIAAAKRALDEGYHQYAITYGSLNFRQALARKQRRFMSLDLDPDSNIVVTCGGTEAIMASIMTICNPGDKVIVFSPFYESYSVDIILNGAEPIYVPLHFPTFDFNPDELRAAFAKGAKAIILCNPSNPAGKVFTREELIFIAELALEYDTFVITDEVYEHIVYEPNQHIYMANLPGMFERTLSCSSLSKTYSITGWRLGYVIASSAIISGIKKIHDFLSLGAAAPLQEAAVTALDFPEDYYDGLVAEYSHRRDIFLEQLKNAGLSFTIPQGAYYVMVDISNFGFKTDTEFCRRLTKNVGVAALPGSSLFYNNINHLIRLHFAKKEETLLAVGERLQRLKDNI